MSGAAAEHKKPEKDEAKHEGGAGGPPAVLGVQTIENTGRRSWGIVKSLAEGFWKRIKTVAGGAWKGTGEQVTGELGEVANRLGFEGAVKEKGVLSRIASISESIAKGVDKVLGKVAGPIGGVVAWPIGAPFRVTGRVLRGVDDIVIGGITGNAPNAGKDKGTNSDGAEPAHHPA